MTRGWLRLKRPKYSGKPFKTRVTVLIAARNEESGIAATIEDLLAQDYPKDLTEIIIVDDHSTDKTAEIIRAYADQGIKLLSMTDTQVLNSYKKKAITEAIALSNGELMVATDADCRMGTYWLSKIVAYYETYDPVMISSPVTFFKEKSFFERLQTLEFSFLIGIGASFIGNKRASTCNGANLAYRKDVFYEVGGFKGIDDLASGDDELLLQKVAAIYPGKIGFLKDPEAIIYTYAKHNLRSFLQQRQRWASKSTRYNDKSIVALGVGIWALNVLLLLGAVGCFFFEDFLTPYLAILGLKLAFEILFISPVLHFFKRHSFLPMQLILSPVHIIYLVYVGLAGNARPYDWKGRTVR
ncbi:glycosyltransferase family 2 protein [Mucilaginibacter ginkgonis]|uniref:Glycosyltransferase n=1 Tax=Mucilaginibacter ginkgonis TaxID=2682091 RepID=A0A6I4I2E8_9SPHI|nr:glycosyltransferase [Mucilaginibacter ginkgonis]QQL49403.1 glycosyltransferase [Mucilaginibacter ginkgonis]